MFLTVEDVCKLLKLSRSKVYSIKAKIGYFKIDGSVRFREDDVLEYVEGCRVNGNGRAERTHRRVKSRHFVL